MSKSKNKSSYPENVRKPPATVHLPSMELSRDTRDSSSSMYVRRCSTLKFDDKDKQEEPIMMWDDDLPQTNVFTSEVVPYGIRLSDWEPENVHFKQSFNQKDLLNEKVDAWKKLAEEAKQLQKRRETISENIVDNQGPKIHENSVDIVTETNVEIHIETVDVLRTSKPENSNGEPISENSIFSTDVKHRDGFTIFGVHTGLSLPCFIVVLVFAILVFPATFLIAFVLFVIFLPIMKLFQARKNKESQRR